MTVIPLFAHPSKFFDCDSDKICQHYTMSMKSDHFLSMADALDAGLRHCVFRPQTKIRMKEISKGNDIPSLLLALIAYDICSILLNML